MERAAGKDTTARKTRSELKEDVRGRGFFLWDRKDQYFTEHRRSILDFQVSERGNRRRLYVVTSPDPENDLPKGG